MKVWLPYVRAGSGVDLFTRRLACALQDLGAAVALQRFPHAFQYAPCLLKAAPVPAGADVILANSWNAFGFAHPGIPLEALNHLCVFDHAITPHKGRWQALFHERLLRRFEQWGHASADALAAVSDYTALQLHRQFPGIRFQTLRNGIDIDLFSPGDGAEQGRDDGLDLLFVGNLSRRKGADLLPLIMRALGPRHRLYYTSGAKRSERLPAAPNLHPLGRLNETRIRDAYRRADVVLFPTRLEGLPFAALEGMACGKPVVASRVASLPELIEHGENGLLCPVDDVADFAAAIEGLFQDADRRRAIGAAARRTIEQRFSAKTMANEYMALLERLLAEPR